MKKARDESPSDRPEPIRQVAHRTRLRTRLTAMIAVPLIAVLVYSIADLSHLQQHRLATRETVERVSRLEPLASLSLSLKVEQSLSVGLTTLHNNGIEANTVKTALDVDLPAMLTRIRTNANTSLDELSRTALGLPDDAASSIAVAIGERSAIDRREASSDDITRIFDAAIIATDRAVDADIRAIEGAYHHLPNVTEVSTSLNGLRLLFDQLDASTRETLALGRTAVPQLRRADDRLVFATAAAQRGELAAATAERLDGIALEQWKALRASPTWVTADQLEHQLLIGFGFVDGPRVDTAAVTPAFLKASGDVAFALAELLRDEAHRVAEATSGVGADVDRAMTVAALRAILTVVATTLVAAITLRSIKRPLERVEMQAYNVSHGVLDDPPLPEVGPREMVVVARAMNELSLSLQRLVAQTDALAAGRIDAPELQEPLPGAVGKAVQGAVDRLASMTTDLRTKATQANAIVEHAGDAIFTVNAAGIVKRVNSAAARLFGYPAEWLIDTPVRRYLRNEFVDGENSVYRVDQPDIVVELTVTQVPNSDLITVYARDVTSVKQREQQLTFQARHDALTGLPNRVAFMEQLRERVDAGLPVTMFFLDLDGFKSVNDNFGHAAGDELLMAFGKRFSATLRPTDLGARFGGDEFVALVHGLTDMATAIAFGKRLIEIIEEPFQLSAGVVMISASVGVARPLPGEPIAELVKRADSATYSAKAAGKGRVRVNDPERETRKRLRATRERY